MNRKEAFSVAAAGAACTEIVVEQITHNLQADIAGLVIGGISGAILYFIIDRRATSYAREQFIAEFVEE